MTWTDWVNLFWTVGLPVLLAVAWAGVKAARQRGYRTTYVEALLGAIGAGDAAARVAGKSFATPDGRQAGMRAAVEYLRTTVGTTAAPALGILSDADHAKRINSRVDAMVLQADITAAALAGG